MENFVIVTGEVISDDFLKLVVESREGGHWIEEITGSSGVISQGKARIYVDVSSSLSDYEEHELYRLGKILKAPPRSVISIHIGHSPESMALATKFSREIMKLLPNSYFDDNYREIP